MGGPKIRENTRKYGVDLVYDQYRTLVRFMALENYPEWTCRQCAQAHAGKIRPHNSSTFHMNICDVCNEWTAVTEPRDFCYPKFTIKRDKHKIFSELMSAMNESVKCQDYNLATHITYYMDEIIHELIEDGEQSDGTAFLSYRDKRREIRERSSAAQRAM